jgi:hypothetical protein
MESNLIMDQMDTGKKGTCPENDGTREEMNRIRGGGMF